MTHEQVQLSISKGSNIDLTPYYLTVLDSEGNRITSNKIINIQKLRLNTIITKVCCTMNN